MWGVVEEAQNEKKAAKWAKKSFDRVASDLVLEDSDEDDASNAFSSLPLPSASQNFMFHGLPDSAQNLRGFKTRGTVRRSTRAKNPSKPTFLTDTAWSVLDDLGL